MKLLLWDPQKLVFPSLQRTLREHTDVSLMLFRKNLKHVPADTICLAELSLASHGEVVHLQERWILWGRPTLIAFFSEKTSSVEAYLHVLSPQACLEHPFHFEQLIETCKRLQQKKVRENERVHRHYSFAFKLEEKWVTTHTLDLSSNSAKIFLSDSWNLQEGSQLPIKLWVHSDLQVSVEAQVVRCEASACVFRWDAAGPIQRLEDFLTQNKKNWYAQ